MDNYLKLLTDVLDNGAVKGDRTNTGTKSVFGRTMRFDITGGKVPLLTTKKVYIRSVIHELLWFISGNTDIKYLKEHNVSIWDSWVKEGTEVYRPMSLAERTAALIKAKPSQVGQWIQLIEKTIPSLVPERGLLVSELSEFFTRSFVNDLPAETKQELNAHLDTMKIPSVALSDGKLGPVYGKQWRQWQDNKIISKYDTTNEEMVKRGYTFYAPLPNDEALYVRQIDQLTNAIELLKTDPDSRRIIVNAWNPSDMEDMALSPCHALFQFYSHPMSCDQRVDYCMKNMSSDVCATLKDHIDEVISDDIDVSANTVPREEMHAYLDRLGIPRRALSCLLYQRSVDSPIGLPLNIACYSILTQMVAQIVGMAPFEFVWVGGDTHVYLNQIEAISEQLKRQPSKLPVLRINKDIKDIDAFTYDDFELVDYNPQPFIRIPVAV